MSSAADVLRTQIEAVLADRILSALTFRPTLEPETISFGVENAKERGAFVVSINAMQLFPLDFPKIETRRRHAH